MSSESSVGWCCPHIRCLEKLRNLYVAQNLHWMGAETAVNTAEVAIARDCRLILSLHYFCSELYRCF